MGAKRCGCCSPTSSSRLGYQRVELDTWSGNERAIRSYQACGFQIEGRLRRGELVDGTYYDTILMGLLREEWEALRLIAGAGRICQENT